MSEHSAVTRPEQGLRSGSRRRVRRSLVTRWLGAGLATLLSVTTLVLALTGRLTLYIAPETVWFASAAAVVTIIGTVWTFTLPWARRTTTITTTGSRTLRRGPLRRPCSGQAAR
ncbi:hypothetical protein [Microbacterium sp. NIBRBAC000506063]|uniref:hypothetical protein n=1 Tax=Microbacterium sp. NIBRBAC000506063 TaxID=2734618 RepID=UPI001CB6E217|nr:hypothetical protein [Microbacterium sp. NIBRBAC000506063]